MDNRKVLSSWTNPRYDEIMADAIAKKRAKNKAKRKSSPKKSYTRTLSRVSPK